jgi:glycosyltransferase involved in cell wall biosynthesis
MEIIDGIEVHYLPIDYDNSFGFYKRSLSFISFVLKSARLARKFRDVDFCYAISVPLTVGIAAIYIRRLYKIPYIFEVGDLWPDAPIQMGFIKNGFFQSVLYKLEKTIYKYSEAIVALSSEIGNAIEKKIQNKEIHVIPNMSDTDFFIPEKKNPALVKKLNVENKFVISYIGAIGIANGLEHFLLCASECQQAGFHIHFILCGEGAVLPFIESESNALGLKNFTIIPFQNRSGVKDVMNVTDAVFISYKQVPILETGSPNKYFDGLASGKLIIVNFPGWISEEIKKNKCGFYIDPKFPQDFVDKVRPFLDSKDLLRQFQNAARALAETTYSRKILSQKFASLFK